MNFFFTLSSNIKNIVILSSIMWYGTLPLPRTPVMYAIISLHDHILFIMCLILALVIYLLSSTLYEYIYSYDNIIIEDDNINNEVSFILKNNIVIQLWNKLQSLSNNISFLNYLKDIYNNLFLYFSFGIKPKQQKKDYDIQTNNLKFYNTLDIIKESIWSQKQYSWLTLSHNTMLEIYWTIIPCFFLIFIAIPSFWLLYAFDEVLDTSVTFRVIGHQWYWSYEMNDFFDLSTHWSWRSISDHPKIDYDSYLLDISELKLGDFRLLKTTAALLLPKDLHIRLLVTSDDVLHSFSVPSFGIKVDAVPGRLNQLSLYIKDQGIFFGQCSELCGANHGFMPIEIWVLPIQQYYLALYNTIIIPNKWWFMPKSYGTKLSSDFEIKFKIEYFLNNYFGNIKKLDVESIEKLMKFLEICGPNRKLDIKFIESIDSIEEFFDFYEKLDIEFIEKSMKFIEILWEEYFETSRKLKVKYIENCIECMTDLDIYKQLDIKSWENPKKFEKLFEEYFSCDIEEGKEVKEEIICPNEKLQQILNNLEKEEKEVKEEINFSSEKSQQILNNLEKEGKEVKEEIICPNEKSQQILEKEEKEVKEKINFTSEKLQQILDILDGEVWEKEEKEVKGEISILPGETLQQFFDKFEKEEKEIKEEIILPSEKLQQVLDILDGDDGDGEVLKMKKKINMYQNLMIMMIIGE